MELLLSIGLVCFAAIGIAVVWGWGRLKAAFDRPFVHANWDCGVPQVTFSMLVALAPLIAVIGIAAAWDRVDAWFKWTLSD